jgi:hypothetical protein
VRGERREERKINDSGFLFLCFFEKTAVDQIKNGAKIALNWPCLINYTKEKNQ